MAQWALMAQPIAISFLLPYNKGFSTYVYKLKFIKLLFIVKLLVTYVHTQNRNKIYTLYNYLTWSLHHGWITDVSTDGRNATGAPANPTAAVVAFGFLQNLFNGFRLIQHRIHSSDPIELRTSAHVLLQCLLSFPTILYIYIYRLQLILISLQITSIYTTCWN